MEDLVSRHLEDETDARERPRLRATRVPPLIEDLFALSPTTPNDYTYFVFHQANQYLIKFIASKTGLDIARVPFSDRRGAASVPLTLALAGPLEGTADGYRVLLLGFGVGLSWGGVSLRVSRLRAQSLRLRTIINYAQ